MYGVDFQKEDDADPWEQPKVLCVDDEPRVLEGLENHLALEYDFHMATSGGEGLEILEGYGPFSVVISDMRMPVMNGAEFLRQVRERSPDTTRMLLTGQSDLESAIAAVNKGAIFRFLSKPCGPDELLDAVAAGVRFNGLILGERQLLQQTLNGAVSVLTDVFALVVPTAFSRVQALKGYMRHLCSCLGIVETWPYELAASLSRLGCITLPPDTLDRLYARRELTTEEAEMVRKHPQVGERLLTRIPRLGFVAEMVGLQDSPQEWNGFVPPGTEAEAVTLGSNLLAVALALDEEIVAGHSRGEAFAALQKSKTLDQRIVKLLVNLPDEVSEETIQVLTLNELRSQMVLDQDVMSKTGSPIINKGRELNFALIERLKNFSRGVGVVEPIRVRVPQQR